MSFNSGFKGLIAEGSGKRMAPGLIQIVMQPNLKLQTKQGG